MSKAKSPHVLLLALAIVLVALAFPRMALAGDVTATFNRGENGWQEGGKTCRQYDVAIANGTDGAIADWSVAVDVDADTEVVQSWNCDAAVADSKLTLSTSESYATTIEAGASLSVGLIVKSASDTPWSTYSTDYTAVPADTGGGSGGASGGVGSSSEGGGVTSPEGDDASGGQTGGITAPVATGISALHVEGTRLCDATGASVRLQGVSLHGLGFGNDFTKYVNEAAFKTLRDDWGANLVRLPVYTQEYGGWCSGGDRDALRKTVNDGVTYATKLGMYVIIDWHILSDGSPVTHQAEAKDFFNEMSARYAKCPNVIYEICNEPNGNAVSWRDIKGYAEAIIPVIRANAPQALIVCGTPTWSQDVDSVIGNRLSDSNTMYSLHFYAATHGDGLRNKAQQALNAGVPIFITESSICDASGNGAVDYVSADKWKSLIRDNGLSFVEWSLCNKGEAASIIKSSCGKTSGWTNSDLNPTGQWYRALMREFSGKTSEEAQALERQYAAIYDYAYYINTYPDLKKAFGNDRYSALRHFITFGMNEGRRASEAFDPVSYRLQYRDLRAAFGGNWKAYYLHYIQFGAREGRETTGTTTMQNPVTTLDGVVYSAVYDYQYYYDSYADLQRAFGPYDDDAMLRHFVNFGMREARQARKSFDVRSYRLAYRDLRAVFHGDWKSYYLHYLRHGKREGRVTSGVTTLRDPVTTYRGVDYSSVYNYQYYLDHYADLKAAFGTYDDDALLAHFVTFGMREGRRACDGFDVVAYRNRYMDLRRAFGSDLAAYYRHYLTYGRREGRLAQ